MLALASPDPVAAHERLVRGYVQQVFPPRPRPEAVSAAYDALLRDVLRADHAHQVLSAPDLDVACHVTRLPGPLPWRARPVQAAALLAGLAAHRLGVRPAAWLAPRVLLHTRPERFQPRFAGVVARLDHGNLFEGALASGTIPVHMQPVCGLRGAPPGCYVDGGFGDYHLRQRYVAAGEGIALFPHYQRRIAPEWFDRDRPGRRPAAEALDDVLQIHPTAAFLASLPDARLPDRSDFFTWAKAPQERIRRWQETVARSERLGEDFRRDLETGALVDRLEPLAPG